MHAFRIVFLLSLGLALPAQSMGEPTSPTAQMERFSADAGRAGAAELGQQFFLKKHANEWSCASCHGQSPTGSGRHASTGKVLEALAPAFNPKSLTDSARIDKWFRRNCKDVLGRECTAAEKADVLAWLISLK